MPWPTRRSQTCTLDPCTHGCQESPASYAQRACHRDSEARRPFGGQAAGAARHEQTRSAERPRRSAYRGPSGPRGADRSGDSRGAASASPAGTSASFLAAHPAASRVPPVASSSAAARGASGVDSSATPSCAVSVASAHPADGEPFRVERRVGALKQLLVLGLALAQVACTSVAYLTQAAAGQRDLIRRARDIDEIVRDHDVGPRMERLLSQVAPIKAFGERHGLKATDNYTKYTQLDRPEVVWVVTASEPLRFVPKQWTFPIVGSFTYLGWFDLREAERFADRLRVKGWDVDVRGSGAYSTEGFFEDPVLSTMISSGADALGELANTLLHESSHATFFVHHQSTLNESVASFVGDGLAVQYVNETVGPDSPEASAYLEREEWSVERERVLRAVYSQLEAIYSSSKPREEKLREKADIIGRLHTALGYKRPISNATLIQYKIYNSGHAELAELLHACDGDWPRFLRTLKQLEKAKLPKEQESEIGALVRPLVDQGCLR
jgi:predicted aminopeptidase